MKITVEAMIAADIDTVWKTWNDPAHIVNWNAASDDWHTPSSDVDLRVGGRMVSRMEAKDGSMGFDFEATFTKVEAPHVVESVMPDDRTIRVEFHETPEGVGVVETFDADPTHDVEFQQAGWQAILDRFKAYVEAMA